MKFVQKIAIFYDKGMNTAQILKKIMLFVIKMCYGEKKKPKNTSVAFDVQINAHNFKPFEEYG